ncbi:fimbria/pilus outer membrane usher protein [Brevundimonas sp. DC300-4]|uniref:fimbria/pilus outer membrane usher protein n=1 Tax=Brevundimonas sp. DC300-4 TaxID=2804594 RepID=UPI003CF5DF04
MQVDSSNTIGEYRRNPPTSLGWGYRLSASRGDFDRQEAEATWLGPSGQVTAQAVHADGAAAARLLVSGGVILAGGGAYATRRVDGAFALVETPGQAHVRIYQENRLVGRTDAAGRAIITALRPYDDNRISLAAGDLPLDVRIDGDMLNIVPRFHGGVAARFGIDRNRGGTVLLQLPDGQPIEPGTPVQIDGFGSFVGYGSEVFVDAIREGVVLEVQGAGGSCRAVLPSPPPETILPRIGPLTCQPPGGPR